MRFKSCTIALLTTAISVAGAQVASHAPAVIPPPVAKASGASADGMVTGRVVARVNGAELTDRDLLREMVSMFPYAQQHNGGFPKELESEIRRGAMHMIIFEELLYQQAKKKGVTIPAAQVSRAETAFRKRFPSKAEFDMYLQLEGLSSNQELRAKIRRSLIIDSMLNSEVTAKSRVTLAQAKAYYLKNPKEFHRPETFHIQSISILPPNAAPDTLKEAKARAEEAYKQAKNTKGYRDFGLLAEKMSDDDFHVNYGDHKPQPASTLPPQVVKEASAMKPGQVSGLIQLGNAFTIFRLISHTPAGTVPFPEIQGKLRDDMQKKKTEQVRAALGKTLRQDAKIEIL